MNSWQTKKIGECLSICYGKNQSLVEDGYGAFPILGSGGEIGRAKEFLYNKPSVLIGRKGTIDNPLYMDQPFWTVDTLFYSKINSGYSPKFIYYLFKTINWRRYNEASGVPSLSAQTISQIKVVIPDLAEQERIVGVLEAWDEYLEKLERKIELKEQSKLFLSYSILNQEIIKGAAQKKVKDLCLIRTGKKDVNQGNPNGAYPFFTCSRDYTYSDDFSYDCEAILIAGNADVGHCKYYAGKFEAYQRTYILSDFSKVDAKYMFYVMSLYFKREIESKKQSGAMSYIKLPMLQNFLVSVPELSVQKDIANKLDNINTEIELLKSKKSQIEQQKKFLLKKIVSGELRTPEDILEKGVSR